MQDFWSSLVALVVDVITRTTLPLCQIICAACSLSMIDIRRSRKVVVLIAREKSKECQREYTNSSEFKSNSIGETKREGGRKAVTNKSTRQEPNLCEHLHDIPTTLYRNFTTLCQLFAIFTSQLHRHKKRLITFRFTRLPSATKNLNRLLLFCVHAGYPW